jgi:hypothetical protein
MKPKGFNKKLSLSKKTIADLNNSDKNRIHGGIGGSSPCEIPTRIPTTCDIYTNCLLSRCMTVCGGPYC